MLGFWENPGNCFFCLKPWKSFSFGFLGLDYNFKDWCFVNFKGGLFWRGRTMAPRLGGEFNVQLRLHNHHRHGQDELFQSLDARLGTAPSLSPSLVQLVPLEHRWKGGKRKTFNLLQTRSNFLAFYHWTIWPCAHVAFCSNFRLACFFGTWSSCLES